MTIKDVNGGLRAWGKFVMEFAAILIGLGIILNTVRTNSERLATVEGTAQGNMKNIQAIEKSIVKIETDVSYIKEAVREIRTEVKNP